MLTPQEIREIQFDKAVFGGYDMGAVDEFIAQVCADYSALYKDNAVLKNKLKLLAETVEEYRSVDEAMRKALITAQNMANEMVADAQKKANELIENASGLAQKRVVELSAKIEEEEKRLVQAKRETTAFVNQLMDLYAGQGEVLRNVLAIAETPEESESVEDTLTLATEQINQSVEEALSGLQAVEQRQAEEPAAEAEESEASESGEPASEEDAFLRDIEKRIEEKPLEELGGKEKAGQEAKVQVYEIDLNQGAASVSEEDEQIAFSSVSSRKKRDSKTKDEEVTKKFDLSELKFGRNYDFDDDDE